MPISENLVKYTEILEISTIEAMITPVAIKLSLVNPYLIKKELLKIP